MRYTIEERHLTDGEGRPVDTGSSHAVLFHSLEGDSIDEAIRLFIEQEHAEIIGTVLKFPGFQAVATIRKSSGVFTLQFTPASQQYASS